MPAPLSPRRGLMALVLAGESLQTLFSQALPMAIFIKTFIFQIGFEGVGVSRKGFSVHFFF